MARLWSCDSHATPNQPLLLFKMFVTGITYTKDIPLWQIHIAIRSFSLQTYANKQLIIINNKETISECQDLEIIYHKDIAIIDRPRYSNGKALLQALQLATGQIIAHFPLNFYHKPDRLEKSIKCITENNALLIAPENKLSIKNNKIITVNNQSNVVPELAVYLSPAHTVNYEIDYGAWWQYPLSAFEQGIEIISIEECPSIELPLKISDYDPSLLNNYS